MEVIPQSEWKWFGNPGHFLCSRWCRFHLCTQVGPWLVSTVGEYVHPMHSKGSEQADAEWCKEHPNGDEIGCGRFYETMVFEAGTPCTDERCNCGMPIPSNFTELEMAGYNDKRSATEGHLAMCIKWAAETAEVPQ